jgi:hypothetical protein
MVPLERLALLSKVYSGRPRSVNQKLSRRIGRKRFIQIFDEGANPRIESKESMRHPCCQSPISTIGSRRRLSSSIFAGILRFAEEGCPFSAMPAAADNA